MSKPTNTKIKKKNTNEADETGAIFFEMLDHISASGRATRELAESVEAWKVTTLIFCVLTIISLAVSILK